MPHAFPPLRSADLLKPTIILVDAKGKQLTFPGTDIPAAYTLPPKSIISVEDGDEVGVGGTIARIPRKHRSRATSRAVCRASPIRSEEHTSELPSLMRISYAVFCLKKKKNDT